LPISKTRSGLGAAAGSADRAEDIAAIADTRTVKVIDFSCMVMFLGSFAGAHEHVGLTARRSWLVHRVQERVRTQLSTLP
jgi:hypothetical protein